MNARDYGYGTRWLRNCGKEVSEKGARCAELINDWQHGIYHIERDVLRADWSGDYVLLRVSAGGGLSTFDNDSLTRLVFLAHDHCIRVQIGPCNPHYLEVMLHPRERDPDKQFQLYYRHPRLMEAAMQFCNRPGRYIYNDPPPPPPEGTVPVQAV